MAQMEQNVKRKLSENDEKTLAALHEVAQKIRKGTYKGMLVIGQVEPSGDNISVGMLGRLDAHEFVGLCENMVLSIQKSAIKNLAIFMTENRRP